MSDHLVLIRTYRDFLQADEAQAELQAAGIYSLLVANDEPSPAASPFAYPVALAVDGRDADIAVRVLAHPVRAVP
jgi:hypothetical protein